MTFLKEHLSGMYDWTPELTMTVFDGKATRRIFNRWNGNQVLFIINVFLLNAGLTSIEEGRNAEKLLLEHLPLDTKSEISVVQWLNKQPASVII